MNPTIPGLCLLSLLAPMAWAQVNRDDIDRNLQERGAREREFHIELDAVPPITPQSPALTRRSVTLPTPGSGIVQPRERAAPPQRRAETTTAPSAVGGGVQLDESQRRRQLELQSQTRPLDETTRRPMLDSQQLQFEREQRANQLQLDIMRDSDRAMRNR